MADPTSVEDLEGRKLDAAVDREIFQRDVVWREIGKERVPFRSEEKIQVPMYSSDIVNAWEVHRFCRRHFSPPTRDEYLRQIFQVVRIRRQQPLAPSQTLRYVEPPNFCRAALRTIRNENQSV